MLSRDLLGSAHHSSPLASEYCLVISFTKHCLSFCTSRLPDGGRRLCRICRCRSSSYHVLLTSGRGNLSNRPSHLPRVHPSFLPPQPRLARPSFDVLRWPTSLFASFGRTSHALGAVSHQSHPLCSCAATALQAHQCDLAILLYPSDQDTGCCRSGQSIRAIPADWKAQPGPR